MLLRRRKQQQQSAACGRNIAISRFTAIGALEPRQRIKWIDHIASAYAQSSSAGTTPIPWDLQATLSIMFQCGLLPAGSEFLPICDSTMMPPPLGPSSHPVVHQQELLSRLFLPKTRKILVKPHNLTEDMLVVLRRVAELAMSYMGALERHGSFVCPALHCFAFAMLWRLGDAQALLALLKSRAWTWKHQTNSFRSRGNRMQRTVNYLGTKWQVSVLMSVVEQVEFGSWSTKAKCSKQQCGTDTPMTLHKRTLQLSLTLLSSDSDYRLPAERIALLLLHRQLHDAIYVASAVLDRAEDAQTSTVRTQATLIYARRRNSGADFFAVALECWNSAKSSAVCRQVQLLHAFLLKWDPEYRARRVSNGVETDPKEVQQQLWKDDLGLIRSHKKSQRAQISRRPSWVAMFHIRRAAKNKSLPQQKLQSFLGVAATKASHLSLLPSTLDGKQKNDRPIVNLLAVRQFFGYHS